MRATFLAILFALVASRATADVIDNVVNNLTNGWNDDEKGVIIMPTAASTNVTLLVPAQIGSVVSQIETTPSDTVT